MAKQAALQVPKRIGGAKLPKPLRRSLNSLLRFAERPLVSDAIAAGLVGAATALLDGKGRRDVIKAAGIGAGAAAVKSSHGVRGIGVAMAIAAAEIAAGLLSDKRGRRKLEKWLPGAHSDGRDGAKRRRKPS